MKAPASSVLLNRKGRFLAQKLLSILNKTALNKKSHTGSLVAHHTSGSRVRRRGVIVTPPPWSFPKTGSFISGLSTLHHCQRALIQGQGSSECPPLCSAALPQVRRDADNQISVQWQAVFLSRYCRTCPQRLRSKALTTAFFAKSSSSLQYFWCN